MGETQEHPQDSTTMLGRFSTTSDPESELSVLYKIERSDIRVGAQQGKQTFIVAYLAKLLQDMD